MSSLYDLFIMSQLPQPSRLLQSQLPPIGPSQMEDQIPKAKTFSTMKQQIYVEASKANQAVHFYKAAFGAEEVNRVTQWKKHRGQESSDLIISAELKIASKTFIVSDLTKDDHLYWIKREMRSVFSLETDDIDAAVEKAVKAGAVTQGEIARADVGRMSQLKDPYDNIWMICSSAAPTSSIPFAVDMEKD